MTTEPNPHRFRMVVALDLSEYAEVVLDHALDQAARHDAVEMHLLTVQEEGTTPADDVKARLSGLVADELESFSALSREGWRVHLHVRCGKPFEEIAVLADDVGADLLVVGRFGVHGAKSRLHVGSVAEKVLRHAPCPTLVVQLVDRDVVPPGCPDCVAVRRDSDGDRWFCDQHRSDKWALATIRFPISSGWDKGPMW